MFQKTLVVGRLGRDPELRKTNSDRTVCSFSVACNRRWTGQDGQQHEKETWFRVSTWDRLAEVCSQHLTKGQLVLVEGEIESSAWLGQDGQPRSSLDLTARVVRFLSPRKEGEAGSELPPPADEEIPF